MLIGTRNIPGMMSQMAESYEKILGTRGMSSQAELEAEQGKILDEFLAKARSGQIQGKGKFAKRFQPTARGFQDYLAADAAYNLDQGPGGAAYAKKIEDAFTKGSLRYQL